MSNIGLGKLFPTSKDLMDHLSKHANLTDEEIQQMASHDGNLDAMEALSLTAERDFCKNVSNNIINAIKKNGSTGNNI